MRSGCAPPYTLPAASPRSRHELTDAPGRLENLSGVLGVALADWADRENAVNKGAAWSGANTACDAIDGMLAALHSARRLLLEEVGAHDDATAVRVDALLALSRARHP